jgi:hypothetical protein
MVTRLIISLAVSKPSVPADLLVAGEDNDVRDVSKLPRRQQEHIVGVVSALVMQHEHERR